MFGDILANASATIVRTAQTTLPGHGESRIEVADVPDFTTPLSALGEGPDVARMRTIGTHKVRAPETVPAEPDGSYRVGDVLVIDEVSYRIAEPRVPVRPLDVINMAPAGCWS